MRPGSISRAAARPDRPWLKALKRGRTYIVLKVCESPIADTGSSPDQARAEAGQPEDQADLQVAHRLAATMRLPEREPTARAGRTCGAIPLRERAQIHNSSSAASGTGQASSLSRQHMPSARARRDVRQAAI